MMLLNPSPGQLSDRMSILKLKVENSEPSPARASALEEYYACDELFVKYIRKLTLEKCSDVERLNQLLSEQNRRNWDSEDAVRSALKLCSNPPTYDQLMAVYLAEKPNAEGNEKRARLVRAIDAIFDVAPEVKLYA